MKEIGRRIVRKNGVTVATTKITERQANDVLREDPIVPGITASIVY